MKKWMMLLLALTLLLAGCSQASQEQTGAEVPARASAPQVPAEESAAAPESSTGDTTAGVTHDASVARTDGDVVEIKERLFIAQTNDIYLNPDDYLGKTIKYEGMYKRQVWDETGEEIVLHYVIRYGPGCCGYDGEAGFEVAWDGEYPQEDAWCEAVGTLTREEIGDGNFYLVLRLSSLTVRQERGAEFVST